MRPPPPLAGDGHQLRELEHLVGVHQKVADVLLVCVCMGSADRDRGAQRAARSDSNKRTAREQRRLRAKQSELRLAAASARALSADARTTLMSTHSEMSAPPPKTESASATFGHSSHAPLKR